MPPADITLDDAVTSPAMGERVTETHETLHFSMVSKRRRSETLRQV